MKLIFATLAVLFSVPIFVPNFSVANAAEKPEEMVKRADNIRNPSSSYEMKIKVESPDNTTVFQVYLKGQDKTLVVTKEPARDKGRNMLMLDRDFQVYVPNLKRSMRLSLAQKLSGQVSNGDISRTRWYGDYEVTKESETASEVQLFLKGKKENLTYAAIRLWLKKDNFQPERAEYLGLNGKTVLKKAKFEGYKSMAGAVRPTILKIEDTNGQASTIQIIEMNSKDIDDSFFTTRNMETMK